MNYYYHHSFYILDLVFFILHKLLNIFYLLIIFFPISIFQWRIIYRGTNVTIRDSFFLIREKYKLYKSWIRSNFSTSYEIMSIGIEALIHDDWSGMLVDDKGRTCISLQDVQSTLEWKQDGLMKTFQKFVVEVDMNYKQFITIGMCDWQSHQIT